MSNELLDFTQRDNFDFLKFSSKVKDDDDKAILKRQCERVLEFAHATVQDMCLLGWHLKELKNSKTWQEVFEPKTGTCFSYFSFQDFCEYAFGFSKTRTSNLLSLSEFVKISGTHTNGFIEERYAGYNTSQLIELSSVPSGQKHYFNPDMTVKDIRLVKKYIASDGFWYDKQRADFDLLTYAKNYAEQGQKKQSKSESSSDILHGQIGIEIPTSELAGDGDEMQDEVQDEVLTDEQRERLIEACLIDSISKETRGEIIEAYKKGNLTCHAFAEFVRKKYGNSKFETYGVIICYDEKGWRISYKSNDIFLTWTTAVGYIVSYINIGEYYDGFAKEWSQDEEYKPNGGVAFAYCDLSAEDFDDPMGEESADEYEDRTAAYAPDEYDEEDEAYEDMQADMQTIEEESEHSIVFAEPDVPLPPIDVLAEEEESPKYDFSSRDKIREFLYGYKSWKKSWELYCVLKIYCHKWKNGMRIYAVEYAMKATLEQDEAKTIVRYFWKTTGQAFEIAKEQLWKYIAAHKDEL